MIELLLVCLLYFDDNPWKIPAGWMVTEVTPGGAGGTAIVCPTGEACRTNDAPVTVMLSKKIKPDTSVKIPADCKPAKALPVAP